jgi:hypothetical protein
VGELKPEFDRSAAMKTLFAVVSVLLLSISNAAFAVCIRDGKTYQTGDQVGPYICMPDGTWRKRTER